MRDRQAGFTLIELMVTVAVIAILAAIALPSYITEARKARAAAEVPAMFSDLRIRIEQFAQENGKYPTTNGVVPFHPEGEPGSAKRPINPQPEPWTALRVRISSDDEVYCSYTWETGLATSAAVGEQATDDPPTGFGFTAPTSDWYYLLAKCDLDADGTPSWYMSSSVDSTIQKIAEGE